MCGILSVLARERPIDEGRMREGLRSLRHRGPDGSGLWLSADRLASLGHARLSVIDLKTGAQPIASEDGRFRLVANGEFYGYERLRRDLEARGHRFRTRSDSEVALHLYEERGADCLEDLRGEFAFVIYDESEKTLFAARDRFGIKPLCYAVHEGALLIGSEAKALFAAGVPAAWDPEAFHFAAALQYVPPDRTLFAGVRQLKPGHFLIADMTGARERRYWDLDYPVEGHARPFDEEELVGEFSRRLDEAVRLRLRADVPTCCHVSGGVDSSAVLALAARHSPAPVDCFTVSFGEAPYDEFAAAKEMAAHVGARLHDVPVSPADLSAALPDAVYASEGLATNGHLSAKFLLSRAIRKAGFKVALTGEGADELTAGYAHLRADLWEGQGASELRASNRLSSDMLCLEAPPRLPGVEKDLGFTPNFLMAKVLMGRRLSPLLAAPPGFDAPARFLESFGDAGQLEGRRPVDKSLYLWCKSALANYILKTLGDGAEMANSVEGRLPYLDHHLFEFARSLPMSMRIRGKVEKYILREAVRPLVTAAVYRREKQPFTAPPVGGQIQDMVGSRSFASIPFFHVGRVREFVAGLPRLSETERAAADPAVMTILSAAMIHERFGL